MITPSALEIAREDDQSAATRRTVPDPGVSGQDVEADSAAGLGL